MDRTQRASRIRITRSEQEFAIILPIRTQPFRSLLYGVWLAVWLVSEAGLVAGLAGWKSFPPVPWEGLVVMLALFSAAGAFIAWRFLWYQWGREVFSVDHDALRVRRDIAGVGRTSVIPLVKLRRVRAESLHYQAIYPSWGRLFIGHGDSQILLNGGEGSVAYGRGLEGTEAADLAEQLNEEVSTRTDEKHPSHTRAGGA